MNSMFTFFLNALKAIIFSPFYLLYFLFVLLIGLFNHIIGEVKVLFSGFKYGSEKENKYTKKLKQEIQNRNGGEQLWCLLSN